MGWLDLIFGKGTARKAATAKKVLKAVSPTQVKQEHLPTGRFGSGRHRPPGDWVIFTLQLDVYGIQYRRENAEAFVKAVHAAEKKGLTYGLRLAPEPDNPHDSNALMIFGQVPGAEWHIGYVDRDTASEIYSELINNSLKVSCELLNIYVSSGGFIDINYVILAPPGNSLSSRMKRRQKSGKDQ